MQSTTFHFLASIMSSSSRHAGMGNLSLEEASEGLKKLLIHNDKDEQLSKELETKIEKLISELLGTTQTVRRILGGFQSFKTNKFDMNPALFRELAEHQTPKFLCFRML
ncbi:CARBONIC ANHYDRASE [Salix purpurea]|uniref:CARBONIC ANHYDRASE n=1 Tax=Salix purpurea TaxID=77065 RepID=A0A9Q0W5C1_SALPP|nr:CARBONIC ANHYDRASE [Salix purpurea]